LPKSNRTDLTLETGRGEFGRNQPCRNRADRGSGARPQSGAITECKSTHVTETVYRHVIVPEIRGGATVMDDVFNDDEDDPDQGHEDANST
jgi:hypothetical protein